MHGSGCDGDCLRIIGGPLLQGFGFRVHNVGVHHEGLWLMIYGQGLWFMLYGLCCMVYGSWFIVYGLWFMVYGLCFMVHGSECRFYG